LTKETPIASTSNKEDKTGGAVSKPPKTQNS